MASIDELERAAESANGLPLGTLASIRKQETGGKQQYIDDPTTYHYPLNSEGRRIAGHTGKVSTAFGPYGILESTAADPGYGVRPLQDKSLENQVAFAASYLAKRSERAGSLEAGLAGYGEGDKYANQVLKRINMATQQTGIPTAATENISRNNMAADALERAFASIGSIQDAAAGTLRQVAGDVQLVKTTEALATAEAQKATREAAVKLGTDPSAASYALDKLISQSNELFDRQMRLAEGVQSASDPSNLLKNPIGFLVDRALMPARMQQFNAATAQAQAVNSRIATLHNLTQEAAQTNNIIKQSMTTESALALGNVAKAEIDLKVSNLQIEALRTNADGVAKVAALRNNNMDVMLRARDQELQEQSIVNAQANSKLQAESLLLAAEERKDRVADATQQRAGQDRMLAAVNLARKTNGNLAPFQSFEEMQIAARMNPQMGEMIGQQLTQGLTIAQTGRGVVASNPWEALKYTKLTGAKLEDGRAKVIEFTNRVLESVVNDPKIDPKIKQKESSLGSAVNDTALAQAAAYMKDITSGKGNIYSPPPSTVLLSDPNFADTYIGTKILEPMVKGGIEELQPKNVVNVLMSDLRAGKITAAQADAELGFMAEKIAGYNNETYRYQETAGLPNMKSVRVPLDSSSFTARAINQAFSPGSPGSFLPGGLGIYNTFGGESEESVDLRNPVERAAYINKQQAALLPPVLRQQAATQSKTGN